MTESDGTPEFDPSGGYPPRPAYPAPPEPSTPAYPPAYPPAYSAPGYASPTYASPTYAPPTYAPPAYAPSGAVPPEYPPAYPAGYGPPAQPPAYGPAGSYLPPPERKRSRAKVLLAAITVAVVVLAGAIVSYVAFRNENSGAGAATPQKAVAAVVADLTNADVLGVFDDLPPAERNALRDSVNDAVGQLKRLNVLDGSADANKVSGVHFRATGLTFAPSDEVINSDVRIVSVTGGILTISSDAGQVPYTKGFLGAAYPNGNAPAGGSTQTIDLAAAARDDGGPLRIATEKVDGAWYPSLMYTLVDAATRDDGRDPAPTAADKVSAIGAGSSDQVALAFLKASLAEDVPSVISLLDPNEDAALHDYGGLIDDGSDGSGITIDSASFTDANVSGGVRVSLKSVSITDQDGEQVSVDVDGDCIETHSGGDDEKYCSADLFEQFDSTDIVLSADEKTALTHLFTALPNVGLVTTQVSGKWYVSPIRSVADVVPSVLSGLSGDDLLTLISLAQRSN